MPMEMPGIEPGAFRMQSERSTTELHPPPSFTSFELDQVYTSDVLFSAFVRTPQNFVDIIQLLWGDIVRGHTTRTSCN